MLLLKLAEVVQDLGIVESAPLQDGRNMVMMLAPHKNVAVQLPDTADDQPAAEAAAAEQPPADPAPADEPPAEQPEAESVPAAESAET